MSTKKTIRPYTRPAGGWDALRNVAKHLIEQDVPVHGAKPLLSTNQPDGFDCPGCAWPDRDHTSTFEFCETIRRGSCRDSVCRPGQSAGVHAALTNTII